MNQYVDATLSEFIIDYPTHNLDGDSLLINSLGLSKLFVNLFKESRNLIHSYFLLKKYGNFFNMEYIAEAFPVLHSSLTGLHFDVMSYKDYLTIVFNQIFHIEINLTNYKLFNDVFRQVKVSHFILKSSFNSEPLSYSLKLPFVCVIHHSC
jgi:hypothetical protein